MKDVDIVLPSLKLSKSLLNWEPTTRIEDGIDATVEWYKNYKDELMKSISRNIYIIFLKNKLNEFSAS